MGRSFVIKKYLGNPSDFNKEKYILDNLNSLSNEEFKFRLNFLTPLGEALSHNKDLPAQIEIKSIKINNLLEGKKCQQSINIEFAKEFIFNSNNIEGSKIPPEKVREIIEKGDTKYAERNEVKEVQNSILAFEYLQKSFKFNIVSIKRLYHILTKDLFREGNLETKQSPNACRKHNLGFVLLHSTKQFTS